MMQNVHYLSEYGNFTKLQPKNYVVWMDATSMTERRQGLEEIIHHLVRYVLLRSTLHRF